jgi:hypothetical protein
LSVSIFGSFGCVRDGFQKAPLRVTTFSDVQLPLFEELINDYRDVSRFIHCNIITIRAFLLISSFRFADAFVPGFLIRILLERGASIFGHNHHNAAKILRFPQCFK